MTRVVISLAAAVACILAAASAQEHSPAPIPGPVGGEPRSALPWLKLEDLAATRERPLFAPGRRPPPSPSPPPDPLPVVEAAPEEPKPLPPSLKGIIQQGTSTLVLLEDSGTAEQVFVRSGDRFGPWQVVAESDHTVRLAAGGEQVVLDLREPR